jgi:hypothetical protein
MKNKANTWTFRSVIAFLLLSIGYTCYASEAADSLKNKVAVIDSLAIQNAKRDSVNLYYARQDSLRIKFARRSYVNYAYESDKLHRFGVGVGGKLYKGLYYETNGGYGSYITDKYNHYKSNFSILTSMLLLPYVILLPSSEWDVTESEPLSPKLYKNIPVYLTSTMFYVPLTKEPYYVNKSYTPNSNVNFSLFVKNDTDWFMFRKKQWGQITPGAGIRMYFCHAREFSIAAGVQYNIQTDFVGRPKTERNVFIRIGFVPPSV